MVRLNLLWPRWADVVAHAPISELRSWRTVRCAAALIVAFYHREEAARATRLAREVFLALSFSVFRGGVS